MQNMKKKVMFVLFPLFLFILSGLTYINVSFVQGQDLGGGGFEAGRDRAVIMSSLDETPVSQLIMKFMQWLLYILGFLAVIAFVISGILYLTSAGDDEKIEKAKEAMIYAIVGVIVALLGLIVMNAVTTWFGGTSATF